MIAVILAAGKGSRLGQFTTDLPKSLLPLNQEGKNLLDYNLQMLQSLSLKRILVVTGFNSDKIEEHLKGYPETEVVYNPFWNHCNVLGSLFMCLERFDDDFLFLHADTLAERPIWQELIKIEGSMVLPFQRKRCGDEEMKVRLQGDRIVEISKEISPDQADGEFLGIAKFSRETRDYFINTATDLFKSGDLSHYMEAVISRAIADNKFTIVAMDIGLHNFVEVDFESDYERAKAEFGLL